MEQSAETAAHRRRVVQPELLGDGGGEIGDALGIGARQVLAHVGRERERPREAHGLGLLGDQVLDREIAEQLHAVAPPALGRGERAVGAVDQALDRAQSTAGAHGADRHGHGQEPPAIHRDGQHPDEPADLVGEAAQRLVIGHGRRQHDELLAAPAAEHVVAAQTALQAMRDLGEHAVADGAPIDVVDALEVVEIEQQHAGRNARAVGAGELGRDRIEHVAAVVEPGERVHAGALLGLGASALGGQQRLGLAAQAPAEEHEAGGCERERDGEQDEHARRDARGGEEGRLPALGDDDPAQPRRCAREHAIGEAPAAFRDRPVPAAGSGDAPRRPDRTARARFRAPPVVARMSRPLVRSISATWTPRLPRSAATAVCRTLASASSKRTIPSGAPASSRTSAALETTQAPVSAER